MKKYSLLVLSCLAILFIGSAFLEKNKLPVEMIAFNSLTKQEQDTIPVSPKDSVVKEVIINEELAKQLGASFLGKKLYAVTFNHTETNSLGNLVVYVDVDKETAVGKSYE